MNFIHGEEDGLAIDGDEGRARQASLSWVTSAASAAPEDAEVGCPKKAADTDDGDEAREIGGGQRPAARPTKKPIEQAKAQLMRR